MPSLVQTGDEGVHKTFALLKGDDRENICGILKAKDKEGRSDFHRENALYTSAGPELQGMLSPQLPITDGTLITQLDQAVGHQLNDRERQEYAMCDLFPNSETLDKKMANSLDPLEATLIADAIMKLHINCLREGFTQRDNHAKNILLVAEGNGSYSAKFIDLGKGRLSFGHGNYSHNSTKDCLHDLEYMVLQKDHRAGDSLMRTLRKSGNEKMQKHYPMHKILENIDPSGESVKFFENRVGSVLKDLKSQNLQDPTVRNEASDQLHHAWNETLGFARSQVRKQEFQPTMPFIDIEMTDKHSQPAVVAGND
ncbi:hypothetical protein L3V83_08675 [Thiotrichales bacterium 19X7-9]|nr:hypothetical protein [Thiotrichales bacterium 19X7-9]